MWSKTVGAFGSRVTVMERAPGRLYLRYRRKWQALGHGDRNAALVQARDLAASLLTGRVNLGKRPRLRDVLARYSEAVSVYKKAPQPREDARRFVVWNAFAGQMFVDDLSHDTLARFVRERLAGRIHVAGLQRGMAKKVSATTAGADVVYLQSVLNWALRERLIDRNPTFGFKPPKTANPKRPVVSHERFEALAVVADRVDPTGRFGVFLTLVEALGWRVSALCQLRAEDVDRTAGPFAPHGRILKRAETDKARVEMWVPLSEDARTALDRLPWPKQGGYLFPSPRRKGSPWRREHARDLLERCEAEAGLPPIAGGDFHPYRRKWASERKALPTADVMAAGGWRDSATLLRCYQHADPATLLTVVTRPKRLPE